MEITRHDALKQLVEDESDALRLVLPLLSPPGFGLDAVIAEHGLLGLRLYVPGQDEDGDHEISVVLASDRSGYAVQGFASREMIRAAADLAGWLGQSVEVSDYEDSLLVLASAPEWGSC